MKYKDRRGATAFLRELGISISDSTLQDLASQDRGPRFSYINGRCLYREEDLLAWIREETEAGSERPRRRSRRAEARTQ